MTRGRPATIAHLPAAQAPLTPEERRILRSAGYGEVSDEKGIYFCRKVRTVTEGWVNDCFQFDARELAPARDKDGKDNDGQRRDNDGQRRDAPARKEAPAQAAGRIEYGWAQTSLADQAVRVWMCWRIAVELRDRYIRYATLASFSAAKAGGAAPSSSESPAAAATV